MRKQNVLSSSGMFLIELLIAILVFAVASAICVNIFVTAHFIAEDSSELNRAVITAQNGAETFKAAGGNLEETAALLNTDIRNEAASVDLFYNSNWEATGQNEAKYIMTIKRLSRQVGCINGEVTIMVQNGDELFRLPVSVLEVSL